MNIRITPSALSGVASAIPSKSDAHRLFICAALAEKETLIELKSSSEDIDATLNCLSSMGCEIQRDGGFVRVIPRGFKKECVIDARESGSTLRFLIPVASALCDKVTFTGCGRLPRRPVFDLLDALSENGVTFSERALPFEKKGKLKSGIFTLPGNVSSQYVTGLMFALPLLDGDSEIVLTSTLESSGYVDITLEALKKFGIKIDKTEKGYFVKGNQKYISPEKLTVDGDWSNSAFFLVSGAVKGRVTVKGLDAESPQGDKSIVEVLRRFGAVLDTKDGISVSGGDLHATTVNISEIPDMLPALSVIASFAKGTTVFEGGARLRIKESDRLRSVADMINGLGGCAIEHEDSIEIKGVRLRGGVVDAASDHRIVMAAAIAGSLAEGDVIINGAEAVNKSYPSFFEDFEKLGGKYCVI